MAVKKKAAKKAVKKAAKKAAPPKGNISRKLKEQPPIKIIIEVVIKREDLAAGDVGKSILSPMMAIAADVEATNNFSYSFNLQNAKVLSLIVESFSQDNPPDSGNFFTPVLDPNDPQQVRVIVVATQNNPGPVGSLSLKYKGKDLADNPIAIDFSGAMGSINQLVNLPS